MRRLGGGVVLRPRGPRSGPSYAVSNRHHLIGPIRPTDDRDLVTTHVVRVELHPDRLVVELKPPQQGLVGDQETATVHNDESSAHGQELDRPLICVPWQRRPSKRRREIIVPQFAAPCDTRPIRAETRAKLVGSIARGRRWLDEILSGAVTGVEQIAAREKCSVRKIHMTISLAFSRTRLGQGGHRRSPAARDWNCSSLRCPRRVAGSVPEAHASQSLAYRPLHRKKQPDDYELGQAAA